MKCRVMWPEGKRSLTGFGPFVGGQERVLDIDATQEAYLKGKGFKVSRVRVESEKKELNETAGKAEQEGS